MKLSSGNFKSRWDEVSGFDLCKLLEDNQNLSMPMITLIDSELVIFAFVYSYISECKVIVSQRHFWTLRGHRMTLCKNIYDCGDTHTLTVDSKLYFERLNKVIDLLFAIDLSVEEREQCESYFNLFKEYNLKRLYFNENKPLIKWAVKNNLI